jgi:hypothetical protein
MVAQHRALHAHGRVATAGPQVANTDANARKADEFLWLEDNDLVDWYCSMLRR